MKPARFAIIGCGRIAQRHADQIVAKGELVAVCDIKKDKADELAAKHKAAAYYNIDDLIHNKQIDVVAVCTPNGLHAEHSIRLLKAGLHVLCEKPMAITTADCRLMIQASENAGRQLFIVKQNRFNPPVTAVKQAIDAGRLGRIYTLQLNCFWNRDAAYYTGSDWKGTKKLDGGILFTQFSHFIDLLQWIAGEVKDVSGYMENYQHHNTIEQEDSGVVSMVFKSGAMGSIHYTVNSHAKNMEGSLTIFGEKGTVKIGGQYLNTLEYQDIKDFTIKDLPAGKGANQYGNYEGSMSNHDKVYENVIDVLHHNAPMNASGCDGLKTVEIIEKIYSTAVRL